MTTYLLRDIPGGLWARFKARAQAEGVPMRSAVLALVAAYADGEVRAPTRRGRRSPDDVAWERAQPHA